jgi:hypothetical protein
MWRDREHELDLADIGGEPDASTHDPTISQPCAGSNELDTIGQASIYIRTKKEL